MITQKDFRNLNTLLKFIKGQHDFTKSRYYHNYLIGALLINKNKRSFGLNNYIKTHPKTIQPKNRTFIVTIHAEVDAINKWNNNWDISKSTLYVTGLTRNGQFTYCNKPCTSCIELISIVGINRVVYTQSIDHQNLEILSFDVSNSGY